MTGIEPARCAKPADKKQQDVSVRLWRQDYGRRASLAEELADRMKGLSGRQPAF